MLKKVSVLFCALLFMGWSANSSAATNLTSTVVLRKDEKLDLAARALIEVYAMHLTSHEKLAGDGTLSPPEYLHFASGVDFIKNQRVQEEALVGFDDIARENIQKYPTNSDSCYVQNIRTDQDQSITIVVGNFPDNYPEDSLACLVAGLWWHKIRSLAGFDGLDWSGSFARLLLK